MRSLRLIRPALALTMIAALAAGCDEVVTTAPGPAALPVAQVPDRLTSSVQAQRAFAEATRAIEPVAERECRARTRGVNCDFRIVIDDRPGQRSNAYQTLDNNGRPVIAFTVALIEDARNVDEIAFIMGHEAAHHIEGHIAQQQQNALAGAVIFAGLASLSGGDSSAVESAQRLGAQVGARTYSKDFELEADVLGTVITKRAGYNPLIGAKFFNRIPDPGNRFLGTHPPNAQRLETVRRTAAKL